MLAEQYVIPDDRLTQRRKNARKRETERVMKAKFLNRRSQVLANRKTCRNDERFVRAASIKLLRKNLDIASMTPSDCERKFIAIS